MSDYCDTSLLVSLYVEDVHSPQADRIVQQCETIILTPLHQAEWHHAIAQNVFRSRLSAAQANVFTGQFLADITGTRWKKADMPENVLEVCGELARSYGQRFGMRTLDTLHVACALELKADRFWTFDERQAKLAKAQGLKTM